ncbi:MAG: hypothetical protein ISS33_05415 [Candidatus Omnitrophica bacterium]|nr:hypothetical protein [Candidatus Omnitrophota bacterium]
MIFKWETEEERLRRFMKIPPKKKLEWLSKMHEIVLKSSSKRDKAIRRKLREMR